MLRNMIDNVQLNVSIHLFEATLKCRPTPEPPERATLASIISQSLKLPCFFEVGDWCYKINLQGSIVNSPGLLELTASISLPGAVARYMARLIARPESRGTPGKDGFTTAISSIQSDLAPV
jgi:hypothetical protein